MRWDRTVVATQQLPSKLVTPGEHEVQMIRHGVARWRADAFRDRELNDSAGDLIGLLLGLAGRYIDGGLARMHRTELTEMYRRDAVGIDLLPAVDVIEQLGRRTLRPQQGRLDLVRVRSEEQVFRLHQSGCVVVIDEEGLAEQCGAAVDEGRNAACDQVAAEIIIIE